MNALDYIVQYDMSYIPGATRPDWWDCAAFDRPDDAEHFFAYVTSLRPHLRWRLVEPLAPASVVVRQSHQPFTPEARK